jgi:hypothetical protein
MLLKTMRAPPRVGSLQEWVIILTMYRLEDVEHARFRALAQLIVSKEKGIEAFEDYMRLAFPALESRKKEKADDAKKALHAWVGSGPLKVTPLAMPTAHSRLKQRVAARLAKREDNQLYDEVTKKWQKRTSR